VASRTPVGGGLGNGRNTEDAHTSATTRNASPPPMSVRQPIARLGRRPSGGVAGGPTGGGGSGWGDATVVLSDC
jgi:hypothetical protein